MKDKQSIIEEIDAAQATMKWVRTSIDNAETNNEKRSHQKTLSILDAIVYTLKWVLND